LLPQEATDQRLPVIALLICFVPSAPAFWLAAGQFQQMLQRGRDVFPFGPALP